MKDSLRNSLQAILWGGMAAGTVDIVAAFRGGAPVGVLQFIASGLFGKGALEGGLPAAAAGLAVHFGLTTMMAAVFVLAARRWPQLLRSPWLSGLIYGALLFTAMNYVIVPHSAVASWKHPPGFWGNINGAMGHGFFVAVPIACIARHFLGQKLSSQWRAYAGGRCASFVLNQAPMARGLQVSMQSSFGTPKVSHAGTLTNGNWHT